jgi:hypothetical protein
MKSLDTRLPNRETKLREVFAKLKMKHDTVLVMVDDHAASSAAPRAGCTT